MQFHTEIGHSAICVICCLLPAQEIVALEGDGLAVCTLPLSGLELDAGKTILDLKGLLISDAEARQLVDFYSGNPLALKITATSIRDLHGSNVNHFLASCDAKCHNSLLVFRKNGKSAIAFPD